MKFYSYRLIRFLFIVIFFALNCHNDTVPQIEIVAKVEDEFLTRENLFNLIPTNLPENQKENISKQYIDQWIQKTVLAKSARKEGLVLSLHENWIITNLEREMLANKYLDIHLPAEIIIGEEEIVAYYEKNKNEFVRQQDEVHLIQLFLEKLDPAISREIVSSNFLLEVITKNFLDSQTGQLLEKNGDLGYVPINSLRPEIKRIASSAVKDRIYGPIKIDNGSYYFQLKDKQIANTIRDLELVKEKIRMRLSLYKREQLIKDILENILKEYKVEIYSDHIK